MRDWSTGESGGSYAYAPPASNAKQIFSGSVDGLGEDADCSSTEAGRLFASEAERLFEKKPYMLIVGLGDYRTYKDTDFEKVYRPYIIIYWANKSAYPLFYNGTRWTETHPWNEYGLSNGNNVFTISGEKVKVQFYFVTCPNGLNYRGNTIHDKCWNLLQDTCKNK